MKIISGTVLCLCIIVLSCSCETGSGESISVMSWNVENLFDDVDNGSEYSEYDPGSGDWDYDSFTRKAAALADVITASVTGGPDILLLQEIENLNALEHLNTNYLKALSYPYYCFFPTENSAVGTAILSRYPVESVCSHAVLLGSTLCGRNIAEARLLLSDKQLVIFINHWKSKLGGAEETEPQRIAASKLLNSLILSVYDEEPSAAVLAAGDFNESWDEASRTGGVYETAIVVSDEPQLCMTVCSRESLSAGLSSGYYNPWMDSLCSGSYCYGTSWETIDQFFLNAAFFDGSGLEYESFAVVSLAFATAADGSPLGWNPDTGLGSSDHLPVMITIQNLE